MNRLPLLCALCVSVVHSAAALNASTGPGIRLSWHPSPSAAQILLKQNVYLADPAIHVAPDGSTLLASHSYFGGQYSEVPAANITLTPTKLFRSTDAGASWSPAAEWPRSQHASFFNHNGTLYSLYTVRFDVPGDARAAAHTAIRKSTDNGLTWTPDTPADASAPGYLRSGSLSTPKTPVIHNNRVWISAGAGQILSASLDADLMLPASWAYRSTGISASEDNVPASWPQGMTAQFKLWSEAQIVASPATGVVTLPKIQMKGSTPSTTPPVPHSYQTPHTALLRYNAHNTAPTLDPANGFVPLPGTEQKFAATHDPVSGKFLALTNTVLPAFEKKQDPKHPGQYLHELVRNTATLYTSADLLHWDLEKIILHSDNVDHDAWQYFNCLPHGPDLLVASRTAFRTPEDAHDTPRGHDSNLLTFHRVPAFRSLVPVHRLKIENATVTRAELTDHDPAPLGNFVLGPQPRQPAALAHDPGSGNIYILQTDGAVLLCDPLGNLLGQAAAIPAALASAASLEIPQSPTTRRAWNQPGSGDWSDPRNWHYFSRPDTPAETAVLGTAATAPATLTLNQSLTLNALEFRNPNPLTLAAGNCVAGNGALLSSGALVLAPNPGTAAPPSLTVHQGNHTLAVPLTFAASASLAIAAASSLNITATLATAHPLLLDIDLAGQPPDTPPLAFANFASNASLAIRVSGRDPNAQNPAPLLKLAPSNLPAANITVTDASGAALPFTLAADGTLSLLPALIPAALPLNAFLAYALIPGPDATLPATNGSTAHLPVTRISNDTLSINFTPARAGFTYEIQRSLDLQTWETLQTIPGGSSTPLTLVSPLPVSAAPKQFLRLKITPKN